MKIPEILKSHGFVGVFVLTGIVGGFLLGRGTAPAEIKTVTVETKTVVEKQTQVINQQVDLKALTKLVQDAVKQNNVVWTREITKNKDGSETIKERREDKSTTEKKSTSTTDTASSSKTQSKTDSLKTVIEQRIKIVEVLRQPKWSVGADLGVNPLSAVGVLALPSGLKLPYTTMFGLSVEKRLFSGFWGGVWGNSRGDTGLRLRVTW